MRNVLPTVLTLALLFGAVYAVSVGAPVRTNCPPECNVILISVDSLRADHVGTYGYGKRTTPSIDAWAKNGVVFENAFASAYLTPIAEMAVHTSLSPIANGLTRIDVRSDAEALTIAEILNAAGYHTIAAGSSPEFFHFSDSLTESFRRGFDEYFRAYFDIEESVRQSSTLSSFRVDPEEAIELVRRPPREKFFLWLTLGQAHWPYYSDPLSFDEIYRDEWGGGLTWNNELRRIYEGSVWSVKYPGTKDAAFLSEDAEKIIAAYDHNIERTDAFLGRFFRALAKSGLDSNTIVVVQSEHGEDMGEHGYFEHYDIFDTTLHVPLIMRIPDTPPRRVPAIVSSVDILPTILDYLDIDTPEKAEGLSARPLIEGYATSTRTAAFSLRTPLREHFYAKSIPRWEPEMRRPGTEAYAQFFIPITSFDAYDKKHPVYDASIRTDEWKLIWRKSRDEIEKYGWWNLLTDARKRPREFELYHVTEDPYEQRNVCDDYPNVCSTLGKQLSDWVAGEEAKRGTPSPGGSVIQPYF